MNLTPAAVDDVGATSPVSMTTQPVTLEFGSCHHFALLRVVEVRVSDDHNTLSVSNQLLSHTRCGHVTKSPQQLSKLPAENKHNRS